MFDPDVSASRISLGALVLTEPLITTVCTLDPLSADARIRKCLRLPLLVDQRDTDLVCIEVPSLHH